MAFNDIYHKQVRLLMRTLPFVAKESCFALKGGTAINLFIRNLPRLSIDIDLTYLPLTKRKQSLTDIDSALKRIAERIRKLDNTIHITESAPRTQNEITKLVVRTKDNVQIKIEITPVLRGCVYAPVIMTVTQQTEQMFGFAEINVLSFSDIYAGKIMAALDRQHPRDLFDVSLLLDNEGISDNLRTAIIVYLISHEHSPHSLLDPVLKDISQDYQKNFIGMTSEIIKLDSLIETREKLIVNVVTNMPEIHKEFLRSFYLRKPDWNLLGVDGIKDLPAVRWREINLDRSGNGTCEELLRKLQKVIA